MESKSILASGMGDKRQLQETGMEASTNQGNFGNKMEQLEPKQVPVEAVEVVVESGINADVNMTEWNSNDRNPEWGKPVEGPSEIKAFGKAEPSGYSPESLKSSEDANFSIAPGGGQAPNELRLVVGASGITADMDMTIDRNSKNIEIKASGKAEPSGYFHEKLKSPEDANFSIAPVAVLAPDEPRMQGSAITDDIDMMIAEPSDYSPESLKSSEDANFSIEMEFIDPRVQLNGYYHENLKSLGDSYCTMTGIGMGNQQKGNDIFRQRSPLGNTVLHIAAMYREVERMEEIIRRAPHLLSVKNSNGDTPLHVAAKADDIFALARLFAAYHHYSKTALMDADKILAKNEQGNTFIHEAIYSGHEDMIKKFIVDEDKLFDEGCKEFVVRESLFIENKEYKSILYLAIEAGYKEFVTKALAKLDQQLDKLIPQGKSPLLAAILKNDQEILNIILTQRPEWIHLRDTKGRTALHYAASIGNLKVIEYLLGKCASCASERDKYGFFPLHLASFGGHIDVVQKLLELEYCPYPREMLDFNGRNILHIAIESGKFKMVRYILKAAKTNSEFEKLVNDKDVNGNTPLHLASLRCHPRIVHTLTRDKRVHLTLLNKENQTALGACLQFPLENSSLR